MPFLRSPEGFNGTAGEFVVDADFWDKRYEAEDLVWGVDPNQWLVTGSEELPPGRALDLGCGEGRNALWLAGRGWLVTGVDFAGVALALAEQADVPPRVTSVQAESRTPARGERPSTWLWSPTSTRSALSGRTVLTAAAQVPAPRGTLLVIARDLSNLAMGIGGTAGPDRPAHA